MRTDSKCFNTTRKITLHWIVTMIFRQREYRISMWNIMHRSVQKGYTEVPHNCNCGVYSSPVQVGQTVAGFFFRLSSDLWAVSQLDPLSRKVGKAPGALWLTLEITLKVASLQNPWDTFVLVPGQLLWSSQQDASEEAFVMKGPEHGNKQINCCNCVCLENCWC